jgi:hypothetical protein
MNNESKPISLEALSQLLDLDIAADATRTQKEVDDELKRRGFDLDELNRKATAALRKALKPETAATAMSASIVEQAVAALDVAAAKIRWYRDLLFHQPQVASGGNLAGAATADEEKAREIVLAKEFTGFELSRIPWAGPKVKLSKSVETEKGTAIYHAFVTSINKHAPQTGALRIVLIAPNGQTAVARLKANDRKKMFEGVDLPADSNELRYAILIE